MLNKKQWIELYGVRKGPVSTPYSELGWVWQPVKCEHDEGCLLDIGLEVRRGRR